MGGGHRGREMPSWGVVVKGDAVVEGFRIERREKEGENYIKDMMVFSLNNERCRIQEGRCRNQVPTY